MTRRDVAAEARAILEAEGRITRRIEGASPSKRVPRIRAKPGSRRPAEGEQNQEHSRRARVDAVASHPFPEDSPWPSPVDGAALLDSLRALLSRYLVLPQAAPEAIALWIVHTYAVEAADYTPYLLITSPVRECGKSTTLDLLTNLAFRAQLAAGITAAALYRRIDRLRPTMLLDEVDSRLRLEGGENLRAVLNTGFHRGGTMTICSGKDHEERDFRTFGPKVLAGIGRVWDTVTSRSIPIRLRRATRIELARLERIRGDRIGEECRPYREQLLRWTNGLLEPLRVADPVVPEELGARQSDIWRPLLAIADRAGGHWPQTARAAALLLHGVAEDESDDGLLLLSDLREIFTCAGAAKLSTARIAEELSKYDDRPWSEYKHGRPITPSGIASLMKRFAVKSKNLRFGIDVQKGYELDQLSEAFAVYLPPAECPATTATRADVAAVAHERDGTSAAVDRDHRFGMAELELSTDIVSSERIAS